MGAPAKCLFDITAAIRGTVQYPSGYSNPLYRGRRRIAFRALRLHRSEARHGMRSVGHRSTRSEFFRPAITNKVRKFACPKPVLDATRFPRKSVTRVAELSVSNLARTELYCCSSYPSLYGS
jgi:hypothetical protein